MALVSQIKIASSVAVAVIAVRSAGSSGVRGVLIYSTFCGGLVAAPNAATELPITTASLVHFSAKTVRSTLIQESPMLLP